MTRDTCGIVIMHHRQGESPTCLRPHGHKGDHLAQMKDGTHFAWSYETELCGDEDTCVCLVEDGPIECYYFTEELTPEEVRLLLTTKAPLP
jgi:hypothetical protein